MKHSTRYVEFLEGHEANVPDRVPPPRADYSEYHVSAGHSHSPPTAVNVEFCHQQTYYVVAGDTPVLVHNHACKTALFGNGGVRAPRAPSYRGTDAGTFKTRDEAWAAANRDKANYRYSSPREECSPTGCHVHLDVYNNQGQLLETRHNTYQQR